MTNKAYFRYIKKWRCDVAHEWPRETFSVLNHLMHECLQDPQDASKAHRLAQHVGMRDEAQINDQWKYFSSLRQKQTNIVALSEKNKGHAGSQRHLRFGKVVSDVLGLGNAIWGCLLSPTGGIAGAGNTRLGSCFGSENFLVLHACVHDAYGYCKVAHNKGPGYNYTWGWSVFPTSNPLSGQIGGVVRWLFL